MRVRDTRSWNGATRLFVHRILALTLTNHPEFLSDATDLAIRFHKPGPQFPKVDVSSPKSTKDSRELSVIRRMSLQMATLTGIVSKVDEKVTNIHKNVANTQQEVVEIREDVKELSQSHNAISKAICTLRTQLVDGYKKVMGKDSDKKGSGSGSGSGSGGGSGGAVMSNKRPRISD